MFEFLKRFRKKEKAPSPSSRPEPKPKSGEVRPAESQPKTVAQAQKTPQPKPAADPTEEGFRVGQTMRVAGLGEFFVHDMKGGKGKSGMGIVYIVLDAATATPYAVKTFQRWCLGTPELVQRFLREAETWIRLEAHPNIVRAHYVSTVQDQPYVFLEYVAGSDLRRKLAAGPLPLENALKYSIQFCRGMDFAQKKVPGLVHRDVKPENCMFTPDDVLKVTDFGLVKVLAVSEALPANVPKQTDEGSESQSQFFQTQKGEAGVGTMPYMAPEQFTDFASVTVRADLYSFGVMLYEMLTGARPFRAKSPEEWYHKHAKMMAQDPHVRKPDIPLRLSHLVMRCMAKDPKDRYADFAAVETELATLLRETCQKEVPQVGTQTLEAWEILNKGAALSHLGRTKDAIACFDKALEAIPDFAAAWLNKGVALAKLGKDKEALECYAKAIEINPMTADAWYSQGISYQNQDALEEALASYDRALELNPLSEATWLNKGVILRKQLRSKEAIACYDKALGINSQSPVAWYNRGYALRQLGRSEEEVFCYDRALKLNPEYVDAWLNRGVALRKLNRLIEALACYNKVLALEPRHANAWYNKGLVLRRMGQAREAREALAKAAALDPGLALQIRQQG